MSAVKMTALLNNLKPNVRNVSLEIATNRLIDLADVERFSPPFCSITWLNNNITDLENHPTISLARQLTDKNVNVIVHLPGKIFNRSNAIKVLEIIKNIGVKNILALQGEFALWKNVSQDDFPYAKDLVKFIRETYGDYFCIGITGYPAGHPRTETIEIDTNYLKQKVDAGADFIITQAIFDTPTLHGFCKRCKENGISLPIIPGIFVINSHASLMHMIRLCKLTLPDATKKFVEENKNNVDVIRKYGIDRAVEVVSSLLNNSEFPLCCVHIFTMNDLNIVGEVFQKLHK